MDGLFYLKASPVKGVLPNAKHIALDPVAMGLGCGGADAYCSTAYSQMYSALGGAGKVLPTLRKKYGVDGRIAFVSFSAGHGFMNPLLNNESPDAVLLIDSTFGGGKTGYVKAAEKAASGGPLLATVTSDKGTTDALQNGDYAWRKFVLEPAGLKLSSESARAPMPAGAIVTRKGNLWYYKYPDSQIHHQDMGKILKPFMEATLVPYWSGALSSGSKPIWLEVALGLAAAAATVWAVTRFAKKKGDRDVGEAD
jgi:hypothetical protein